MFAQFRKRRIIRSWFRKLFWNQCCDAVQNLPWTVAFSNFYVFHSTLIYIYIYIHHHSDHLVNILQLCSSIKVDTSASRHCGCTHILIATIWSQSCIAAPVQDKSLKGRLAYGVLFHSAFVLNDNRNRWYKWSLLHSTWTNMWWFSVRHLYF